MNFQMPFRLLFVAVFSLALQFILISCASPSPEPGNSKEMKLQERSKEQPLENKAEDQDYIQIQDEKMEVSDQPRKAAPASAPQIERSESHAPKKARAKELEDAMGSDPENPERGGTVITTNN